MKKLLTFILMGILTSLFGFRAAAQEVEPQVSQQPDQAMATIFQNVSVAEFEKIIADENVIRLDVRSEEEYAEGHIAGTMNIDVLKSTFKKIAQETLPKDKTIALYCRSGKRSLTAAGMLSKLGYKVVNLSTGINGWVEAGKPIVK